MKKMATFEKVSFDQFKKDCEACNIKMTDAEVIKIYNSIKIPERATQGSAGYDFFTPFPITLSPGQSDKFPTGIRCMMLPGWVLMLFPRSGHGFKYRFQLDNTVGIIDQDYMYADNEGHIHAKVTNDGKQGKLIKVKPGEAFMQGIFLEFGLTMDDNASGERYGGFGSTDRRS